MAVNRWSIPFDKLAAKVKQDVDNVVKAVTLETFSRVILRTPVDTGRARANWIASWDSWTPITNIATDPSGAAAIKEAEVKILRAPVGGVMYLTNSLPYAATLEYGGYPNPPKGGKGKTEGGFSRQAPQGMVRVTVEEVEGILMEKLKS